MKIELTENEINDIIWILKKEIKEQKSSSESLILGNFARKYAKEEAERLTELVHKLTKEY